jgi:hypothetical protein
MSASRRALIGSIEKRTKMQHRSNETSQRVETIPGIGVLGATAIVATAAGPTVFRSGRDFAAWIGLVPRQDSTGGKQKLGPKRTPGNILAHATPGAAALAARELLPHNHFLVGVDPVNLKHVLGDIQTDRGNLHLDGSPHLIRYDDHPMALRCRERAPSTTSKAVCGSGCFNISPETPTTNMR